MTNEGYGFGFLVSAGKEGETLIQSLIPDGVAWKVSYYNKYYYSYSHTMHNKIKHNYEIKLITRNLEIIIHTFVLSLACLYSSNNAWHISAHKG